MHAFIHTCIAHACECTTAGHNKCDLLPECGAESLLADAHRRGPPHAGVIAPELPHLHVRASAQKLNHERARMLTHALAMPLERLLAHPHMRARRAGRWPATLPAGERLKRARAVVQALRARARPALLDPVAPDSLARAARARAPRRTRRAPALAPRAREPPTRGRALVRRSARHASRGGPPDAREAARRVVRRSVAPLAKCVWHAHEYAPAPCGGFDRALAGGSVAAGTRATLTSCALAARRLEPTAFATPTDRRPRCARTGSTRACSTGWSSASMPEPAGARTARAAPAGDLPGSRPRWRFTPARAPARARAARRARARGPGAAARLRASLLQARRSPGAQARRRARAPAPLERALRVRAARRAADRGARRERHRALRRLAGRVHARHVRSRAGRARRRRARPLSRFDHGYDQPRAGRSSGPSAGRHAASIGCAHKTRERSFKLGLNLWRHRAPRRTCCTRAAPARRRPRAATRPRASSSARASRTS